MSCKINVGKSTGAQNEMKNMPHMQWVGLVANANSNCWREPKQQDKWNPAENWTANAGKRKYIFHLLKLISVSVINFNRSPLSSQMHPVVYCVRDTRYELWVIFSQPSWPMCRIYARVEFSVFQIPVIRRCKFSVQKNWKGHTRTSQNIKWSFFFFSSLSARASAKHLIDLWYAAAPHSVSSR